MYQFLILSKQIIYKGLNIYLSESYVINYLTDKKLISQVTDMVLSAFNVKSENKLSEQLANDAMQLTSDMYDVVKTVGSTVISGITKKEGQKETKK